MKLVSYLKDGHEQLALLVNDYLYDTDHVHPELPSSMGMFLNFWEEYFPLAQAMNQSIIDGKISQVRATHISNVVLLAPVPHPSSYRDAYAFRQHVETARRNRGAAMIAEFDQFPVFYFSNHHSIQGPGEIECMPDHFEKLDFELEAAIVICKSGKNIPAEEADDYIGGFMIMNDFSARTLQMEEMTLNLGPAKGKDFATATGPWLVTPDELEDFLSDPQVGHTGKTYNLTMTCRVNDIEVSRGNLADMHWTFAEIIERCSYGTTLYPGDVIGSGTVGTGCFLELNGTAKLQDNNYTPQWLKAEDHIELEITGLGILSNTITAADSDMSLLAHKKGL